MATHKNTIEMYANIKNSIDLHKIYLFRWKRNLYAENQINIRSKKYHCGFAPICR